MVTNLKQIGGTAIVHVVTNNIVPMTALEKGDRVYIPSKPTWLAEQRGTNPNARAHVLALLMVEGELIVKPVYFNQLNRRDRITGKLVITDKVNSTVNRGGTHAFNALCAGKVLTVTEVNEDANDYAYDQFGNRNVNEDGTPKYTKTKAFGYAIAAVKAEDKIDDAKALKMIEDYIAENYKPVEDEELQD